MVHVRGQRLHVAECGVSSSPLVLFLHSAVGGWFDWRRVLPLMAELPVHAVAVSGRGYGTSDRTPSGYSPVGAADDAAGLIRALGHSRAIVVGQGYGALVAWTLAARNPQLVTAVVSCGMPHPVAWRRVALRRPFSRPLRASWSFGKYGAMFGVLGRRSRTASSLATEAMSTSGPGFADSAEGLETARLMERSLRAGALHPALQHLEWLATPTSPSWRRWMSQFSRATVPATRLVVGAGDPLTSRRLIDASPTDDVVTLPGVGHHPGLEAPDEVAAVIADALRAGDPESADGAKGTDGA
ncbi:alpha/beta fold hydrolase [uncultured Corynebacterium sp.]|uniref:alpha/beta fold hydrolase n=1 Tax=uncultured Corynebacterium sp. TaxID=159447 RepID=UPI0025DC89B7|nr:alpha/beta hydrolase [uncultured Corynebacterium sp.]